jgi:hypothetical protein
MGRTRRGIGQGGGGRGRCRGGWGRRGRQRERRRWGTNVTVPHEGLVRAEVLSGELHDRPCKRVLAVSLCRSRQMQNLHLHPYILIIYSHPTQALVQTQKP